jgi:hypothetical protein
MSDLSVLWHEYERCEDLTRQMTADVIALKRARYQLPGSDELTKEERRASTKRLRDIVGAIAAALSSSPEGNEARLWLPGALVEQIRQTHGGLLPRFVEDLRTLHQHLSQGEAALTERDVALLDDLGNSVHTETSRVFQCLWRK